MVCCSHEYISRKRGEKREIERERERGRGGGGERGPHLGEISSKLSISHTQRFNKKKKAEGYESLLLESLVLSLSSESESPLSDTILLSLEDDFDFLARYFFALW